MLSVHRAERADGLVNALSGLLSFPLEDPFAAEVVVVPTRGMERWLSQRLSLQLGICANVEFAPARRLISEVVAAASGIEQGEDPWSPERLVWPLLEAIDAADGEPWAQQLCAHTKGHPARRFAIAASVSRLFARYELHRPDMVLAWAAGAESHWQAELWRAARRQIGTRSPAQRFEAASTALAGEPALVDLPPRVSLFGLTRLAAGHLRILSALAADRDVHLFLLHPSPALWSKLADVEPVTRRREDPTTAIPANRLLASWGQDAREMQLVLAEAMHHDVHHPVEQPGGTLLTRIQADVRADRAPQRHELAPMDESIRIHSCHGRARQVEVLRDQILHLLADDPSLEPRDVIVMCPDVEAFAPLIQATFGAGEMSSDAEHEPETLAPELRPPDLRVRLADRALRQTNPVLGVIAHLLELASQRMTASQVLDFCDREPVRRRFSFDDDSIERLERWVAETGIRWGFNREHRSPYRLDALDDGTWRKGLDRLLVGVAMTEDEQRRFAESVLPLDDVDSSAIELAGRFCELIDRLQAAIESFNRPQHVATWAEALAHAADALTASAPREAWQRNELQQLLDDLVREAGEHRTELSLAEVRALLAERLQGRPTRANFRTGHLTICTLHPMRSVPHRIVCLLGLDDGAFPRRAPRDGDDLMLADPHIGERDSRAEDRQMLLDALMAASERLVITFTGNDERTNASRPPAVPVDELVDVIERACGPQAREQVLRLHPLQPFDPRNFQSERPWSFDSVTLEGAQALASARSEAEPFLAAPLPEVRAQVIELDDLVRFVEHPVRAFLRGRLGLNIGSFDSELADQLPVELDGLSKWSVGNRLLQARLKGIDHRDACLAEIARGTLPPGLLGKPVVDEIHPRVDAIASEAERLVPSDVVADSVEVRAVLPDGRTLSGSVAGVAGDTLRTVIYSEVSAKHRLAAWVRLLALSVAHPQRPFTAVTIGRSRRGVKIATLDRIEPPMALEQLASLLALFDEGMREPLPLYCKTSAAHAAGGDPGREWTSEWNFDKEDKEPEHVLVLGGELPFERIRGDARFGTYAERLWTGLLQHEQLEQR